MSIKGFLKHFFPAKKIDLTPKINNVEWTEKCRFELNTFLKTDSGKALQQILENEVLHSQVMACRPAHAMGCGVPLDATERFSIAYGKETMLSKFIELGKMENEQSVDFMDEHSLNEILNNRINGYHPQEVEL